METDLPRMGKVSPAIFNELILKRLGRHRPEVVVPPRNGVDVGVVELGNNQVMVTTTDPVFVVPQYGWERAAWFAVHILASDAATSGLTPKYITVDLNLPLSMARAELETLWTAMHNTCDELGLAVISGHTGRYAGCDYPMVGGATVVCIGASDSYVTPAMARPGDRILITKGPAVEAAGIFAVTFPDRVAARYGAAFADKAQELFWQMSVVDDALTAASAGVRDNGVTAMHDATECGILGGLHELASASGVGLQVHRNAIVEQEAVRRICELFGMAPFAAISEGTLIATCRPQRADEIQARLEDRSIPVSQVGEIVPAEQGLTWYEDSRALPLEHPETDPFWGAFAAAAASA